METSNSYLLITSRERDRLLYPHPCHMQTNIKTSVTRGANIFSASNPICDIPIYNFSFSNFDNNSNSFLSNIISIEGKQLTLDTNIETLLNRQISTNIKLVHTILEMENILKNFYITIELGGNQIIRKIITFNHINSNIVTIEHPFPLIVNQSITSSNTLPCSIKTLTSNVGGIYLNGNFLEDNDFYYNNKRNKYLYNVSQNEIRSIDAIEDNQKLTLSSPFSNENYNDQYFLFFAERQPLHHGKILRQLNNKFYSFQPSRLNIIRPGKGYTNGEIVYLQSTNDLDSIEYTHFKLENLTRSGEIKGMENFVLYKIGNQTFDISLQYEVIRTVDNNQNANRSTVKIGTLELTFKLNISKFDHQNNFFLPILMTNQYRINADDGQIALELHPNASLLNTIDSTKKQPSLYDHFKANGLSPITSCFALEENGVCAIQTKAFSDIDTKLSFLEQVILEDTGNLDENIPLIEGIDNFLILDYKKDGVQELSLHNSLYKKYLSTKIALKNIIIPNQKIKGIGCRTCDLSYILVDIDNVTSSLSFNHNVLQSNSEAATQTKFFVPLSKCVTTDNFLSVSLQNIQCPISFSPHDTLSIRILLPTGETLIFEEEDYTIPYEAKMSLNVSLFFEVEYD